MKCLWVILFVIPLFAQDINKHNISLGMFDDKTGISFIGYSYNIRQTEMDEFFIGRWDYDNGIYRLCRMETLL